MVRDEAAAQAAETHEATLDVMRRALSQPHDPVTAIAARRISAMDARAQNSAVRELVQAAEAGRPEAGGKAAKAQLLLAGTLVKQAANARTVGGAARLLGKAREVLEGRA